MERPEFTKEQEEWIYYEIGSWYLHRKNRITSGNTPHRLGLAKEHLKEMLMQDKPKEERAVPWDIIDK